MSAAMDAGLVLDSALDGEHEVWGLRAHACAFLLLSCGAPCTNANIRYLLSNAFARKFSSAGIADARSNGMCVWAEVFLVVSHYC